MSSWSGIVTVLASIAVACAGCTAAHLPSFQPQSVDRYAARQQQEGLVVAAEVFTDKQLVKQYFGTFLPDVGIWPVLLVAENRSASSSFILLKDRIGLDSGGQAPDEGKVGSKTAATVVGGIGTASILLAPGAALVLLPMAATMGSSASEEKYNFVTKAFRSDTLSPGESAFGFVYFQVPRERALPFEAVLYVDVFQPGQTEGRRMTVPLHFKKP